jgi:predicted ArsR family transcriptional regulator
LLFQLILGDEKGDCGFFISPILIFLIAKEFPTQNANMEKSSSSEPKRPTSSVNSETMSRLLHLLQTHPEGISLDEIIKKLGVSRLTALKWINSLQNSGIVFANQAAIEGKRGRPKILYGVTDTPIKRSGHGSFVLTGIGKASGQDRYRVLEKTLDFQKINEMISALDQNICASSIADVTGKLLGRIIKHGYESRLDIDKETKEHWGAWVAIITALTSQQDKILSKAQYIAVGREEFKSLIIPFHEFGLIVNLTIEKNAEATSVTDKVSRLFNRLAHA